MADEALAARFRSYLLDSNLGPGDKLETELELAARFEVPRGAMREVIMSLCHMGLLERIKNKGTFVKGITPEKLESDIAFCFQLSGFCFEDLKEARLYVETALAPLIARRLSPAALERLRANATAMERLVDQPEEADKADRDFHLALLSTCDNPVLKMFSNVLHLLFRKQFRGRFLNPAAIRKSARDHRAILDALVSGDAERARKIIAEHIAPT